MLQLSYTFKYTPLDSSQYNTVPTLTFLQVVSSGLDHPHVYNGPYSSQLGQLPYLTHGLHSVAGFHAIVKYVAHTILRDPSQSLGVAEKAQQAARVAHVESSLGDLTVSTSFYCSNVDRLTQAPR